MSPAQERRGPRPQGRVIRLAAAGRGSFTLVELATVIGILALLFGLLTSMIGPRTIRGPMVKTAADQLASVLRKARQMAMDHRAMYGVTFNIANAPGSSGSVLNNRSGGHWYRIIGPHDPGNSAINGGGCYYTPLFFDRSDWGGGPSSTAVVGGGDVELGWWLSAIQGDMVGEKYVLPKGQARFIALMDEDNGPMENPSSGFPSTYPRPWFGNFMLGPGDNQPRLYAWGGYDQAFTQGTRNYSGFFYQGDDGPLTGCENPAERDIIDDPAGTSVNASRNFALFAKGQVRPLINGDWLDCVILFNPDGTATMPDWMRMRHQYGDSTIWWSSVYWSEANRNIAKLGPGDMCNEGAVQESGTTGAGAWQDIPYNTRYEASSYAKATGMYYITIGSDAPDDTVNFPTATAALASMMPLYRVGVSKLGEVKVVKVSAVMPPGKVLDSAWQGAAWNQGNLGFTGFFNNIAIARDGQQLMPAEDVVTATMMEKQQWWFDP